MKKKIACLFFIFLAAAFVLLPTPTASLSLRFYFEEIEGSECSLYYTTDTSNMFSDEKQYRAEIDPEKNMAAFRLDPSLNGYLTGLRLDFPSESQLCCVKNVTVSSGGVIKRRYDPCEFFAEENIIDTHGIDEITRVPSRSFTYFSVTSDDPYIVLSEGLSRQVMDCYSHYRLTRLCICLFLLACFLIGKKKIFKAEPILP